ncbi:IS3 family transposase, partial [Streptococcus lutetiensis]
AKLKGLSPVQYRTKSLS